VHQHDLYAGSCASRAVHLECVHKQGACTQRQGYASMMNLLVGVETCVLVSKALYSTCAGLNAWAVSIGHLWVSNQ
jgi:hypothetical protein